MELGISDLKISRTRWHYSRMRTARLPSVRVSLATTRCQYLDEADRYTDPMSGGRGVGTKIPGLKVEGYPTM